MAAPREPGGRSRQRDSEHAEGIDRDEYPAGERVERPERRQRDEDHRSHAGGGARSLGIGRFGSARGESHSQGYCQESGRELARGIVVRSGAGSGTVPLLSKKERRLRPAIAQTPGVVGVHRGYSSPWAGAKAERQERQS